MDGYLRCAIPDTTLAALNSAGQFLDATSLKADVLPPFVQCFLDFVGYVDDLRHWDDIVPAMDEAIEDLVEPETVFGLAVLV